jgi:hypothetical protein
MVVGHNLRNSSEAIITLFETEIEKIREEHNKLFKLMDEFLRCFSVKVRNYIHRINKTESLKPTDFCSDFNDYFF